MVYEKEKESESFLFCSDKRSTLVPMIQNSNLEWTLLMSLLRRWIEVGRIDATAEATVRRKSYLLPVVFGR
jgi:hypothetical protein